MLWWLISTIVAVVLWVTFFRLIAEDKSFVIQLISGVGALAFTILTILSIAQIVVLMNTPPKYLYVEYEDKKIKTVKEPTHYVLSYVKRKSALTFINEIEEFGLEKDGKTVVEDTTDINEIFNYFESELTSVDVGIIFEKR